LEKITMLDDDFACRELTEIVREHLDAEDILASRRHEQLFVSLVRNQQSRKQRKKRLKVVLGVAAVAAAAVLSVSISLFMTPGDLAFKVGNEVTTFVPGEPGTWVQADIGETMEIRFDQGSRFKVNDGCAARVVESGEQAVTIELSKGDITANVKGNKKTHWKINAGPFTVTVLGTSFDVSWDAASSDFDVKVKRGVVLVQGAGLSRYGVRLLAGQQLAANGRSGDVSMSTPQHGAVGTDDGIDGVSGKGLNDDSVDSSNELDTLSSSELIDREKRIGKDHSIRGNRHQWVSLYRQGRFEDAVLAAEKEGLARMYGSADAQTLWNLADAARNAHRVGISNDSLLALRKRFPTSRKAKLAAFIIGRSAMDLSGSLPVATQWFQMYLTESPDGPMAEEVHGRLMTVYSRMKRPAAAKRIAAQYLQRYPNGLYVGRAKQVLQ
jgi:hypothetical protein